MRIDSFVDLFLVKSFIRFFVYSVIWLFGYLFIRLFASNLLSLLLITYSRLRYSCSCARFSFLSTTYTIYIMIIQSKVIPLPIAYVYSLIMLFVYSVIGLFGYSFIMSFGYSFMRIKFFVYS